MAKRNPSLPTLKWFQRQGGSSLGIILRMFGATLVDFVMYAVTVTGFCFVPYLFSLILSVGFYLRILNKEAIKCRPYTMIHV